MYIREALESAENIFYYIKTHKWQEIAAEVSAAYNIPLSELLSKPMGGYRKGGLSGAYPFVLQDLCSHADDYIWFYDRLQDAMSRYVLWKLLCFRLAPSMEHVAAAAEREYKQYFDPEIIACGREEVFADCGGFTGDSAQAFMDEYKNYRRIYVFEPSKANCRICRDNLAAYPGIEIVEAGVSSQSGQAEFSISGSSSSVMTTGRETEQISLVSLDDAIKEPVSFIKMDIEGAELDALEGAKGHIANDRPKMAVCVYHLVSDLWEIPRKLDGMLENCALFLRHYQADQPWETVLYAIPAERLPEPEQQTGRSGSAGDDRPNIYSFPPFALSNVQILKDQVAVPYVYYRHFGKTMTIVTKKAEDYTYLDYLKGAQIEYITYNDSREIGDAVISRNCADAYCHYLLRHYNQMDLLFLFGFYTQNAPVAQLYKKLRPDGKIYLKTDANSSWTDRIPCRHPAMASLLSACDVISCESKKLQRLLSKKWPWRIDYIPNGYYDFLSPDRETTLYSAKENIILTVGRIGTRQKNNEMLLEAFAKAAGRLESGGWKVRLVGNAEPEFYEWLREYFDRFPSLEKRIELTGPVFDRPALFEEYKRAKIFALTSRWEGGAPNAYAEAVSCGCVPVVTDIDAGGYMTDDGRLGAMVPRNDTDGLAEALADICLDEERMRRDCGLVQQYADSCLDYNKLVERLDLLLRLN